MDLLVREEYDELICLKQNHNEPIYMVVMDEEIPLQDRILCSKCFRSKRQVTKNMISIDEAKNIIAEKLAGSDSKIKQNIDGYQRFLENFQENLLNLKSSFLTQIDEILRIIELWKADVQNRAKELNTERFINYLELLFDKNNGEQTNELQKSSASHFQKINSIFLKLMNFENFQNCYDIFKSISPKSEEVNQHVEINEIQIKQESIELVQTLKIDQSNQINQEQSIIDKTQIEQKIIEIPEVNAVEIKQQLPSGIKIEKIFNLKQREYSFAMAFNPTGKILAAGCNQEIKLWQFDQGLKELAILKGFSNNVLCIVFSKKYNWLASGSRDNTIRLWKEQIDLTWLISKPAQHHTSGVQCLIINEQENQLISCSSDKSIKVWIIDYETNSIDYDYSLESKHTESVNCITLNKSNTSLISCSNDKKIVLWSKGENGKWGYQNYLTLEDIGYRISYISDTLISYQQSVSSQIILLEQQNRRLKKKDKFNFLNSSTSDSHQYFPITTCQMRQIIVQKYNQIIQIINYSNEGNLKILDQIDCGNSNVYGCLSQNGEFLVTWNYGIKGFQIYKIQYE